MNKYLYLLAGVIATPLILYSITGFILMSFSPSAWSITDRAMLVLFSGIFYIPFISMWLMVFDNEI